MKNPRSTFRVDLFASRLKESTLSFDTVRYSWKGTCFQKESTLPGNSYYEKEEGKPYSFAQLVYKSTRKKSVYLPPNLQYCVYEYGSIESTHFFSRLSTSLCFEDRLRTDLSVLSFLNLFLFIRGLSCPCSFQKSLTQNCRSLEEVRRWGGTETKRIEATPRTGLLCTFLFQCSDINNSKLS